MLVDGFCKAQLATAGAKVLLSDQVTLNELLLGKLHLLGRSAGRSTGSCLLDSLVLFDQLWSQIFGEDLGGPLLNEFSLGLCLSVVMVRNVLLQLQDSLILRCSNGVLDDCHVEIVGLSVGLQVAFKFFSQGLVSQLGVDACPLLGQTHCWLSCISLCGGCEILRLLLGEAQLEGLGCGCHPRGRGWKTE